MTQPHDAADDDRIVEIYAAANEIDAGAMRAALEAEGIDSRLVGDLVGNAFDVPLGFSGPRIWVREADAPAARRIIEQLQDRVGEASLDASESDRGEAAE